MAEETLDNFENDEFKEEKEEVNSYSNNSVVGTPPDDERQSIVEELYNCEKRVRKLILSWEGEGINDAVAGRRFLNNQYSALVGVINTTNAFTNALGDDTKAILYRAVEAFIKDLANNSASIPRKHWVTMTYTYWHTIELFLGLPRNKHGSNVLKDALAGLNTPEPEERKESMADWAKRNLK